MDESIIRGLVMGGVLGAVGLVATLIWKVIQSPSEGARRFKVVLMIAAALGYAALIAAGGANDRIPLIIIGLVVVAGIWVFKGMKK